MCVEHKTILLAVHRSSCTCLSLFICIYLNGVKRFAWIRISIIEFYDEDCLWNKPLRSWSYKLQGTSIWQWRWSTQKYIWYFYFVGKHEILPELIFICYSLRLTLALCHINKVKILHISKLKSAFAIRVIYIQETLWNLTELVMCFLKKRNPFCSSKSKERKKVLYVIIHLVNYSQVILQMRIQRRAQVPGKETCAAAKQHRPSCVHGHPDQRPHMQQFVPC